MMIGPGAGLLADGAGLPADGAGGAGTVTMLEPTCTTPPVDSATVIGEEAPPTVMVEPGANV